MSEQHTTEACTSTGSSPEPQRRFGPFVGTFKAEVKLWMGPGEPLVSTGVMVNTLDLGGRFLRQEYTGDQVDGPFPSFEGRGFWGYNPTIEKYEGFWIDNASSGMQTETGDVDGAGKEWTMVGETINPANKQPMKKRSMIVVADNDHHSMETYFTGPDGNEFKAMAIVYERVS